MFIERITDPLRSLFAVPNTPDALDWDDWDQWEDEAARRHPVRWLLGHTIPRRIDRIWRRFVHEPWYWLKCAVWHRYNVVRVRTLPPTWCDRDRLLLHAAFQVLTDFVERERPWELYEVEQSPDWEKRSGGRLAGPSAVFETVRSRYLGIGHDEEDARERAAAWREVALLYFWWKARVTVEDDDGFDENGEYSWDAEERKNEEDTEMLCRLAKVRRVLWT